MISKTARKFTTPAGPAPDDFGRLLTVRQVAEKLGVCGVTVRRLVLRGDLPSVKLGQPIGSPGGQHRIPERCVNEWINRNLNRA